MAVIANARTVPSSAFEGPPNVSWSVLAATVKFAAGSDGPRELPSISRRLVAFSAIGEVELNQ